MIALEVGGRVVDGRDSQVYLPVYVEQDSLDGRLAAGQEQVLRVGSAAARLHADARVPANPDAIDQHVVGLG